MQAMRSRLRIQYNGVEATEIIANDCSSFTWKDNATGAADTITLNLSNLNRKWMNGFFPADDDMFKAWIQLTDWAVDFASGSIFCGNFRVDDLVFSGFPETLQLSGISTPIDNEFIVKEKNKTWKKTTVQTVLNDIASNAGISLAYDADDVEIETISQTGQTDLNFAFSLCSSYGINLKLYNDKLVAYDQTKYEGKAAKYNITDAILGGGGAYNITRQLTKINDSVKIQYTQGKKTGDTLTYEFTAPGCSGDRPMFISSKAESLADAELKAKAALRENRRNLQKITLKMMGSAKYMATDCFNLVGFGKLDGKYFIDSVTHQRSGNKYTVSISAHLTIEDF